MSIISKCPKCQQPVLIPEGVDSAAESRCPLCEAEYPLSEALAEAPPALIIIGQAATQIAPADSDASSEGSPSEAAAGIPAEGGFPLDPSQDEKTSSLTDTGVIQETRPLIDTGQAPVDADAFAGFGEAEPGASGAMPSLTTSTARPQGRRKQKSMQRTMIETFVGGILGLTIGYYAFCWMGLNLPKLPLPFLPHTIGGEKKVEEKAKGEPPAKSEPAPGESAPTKKPGPEVELNQPEFGSGNVIPNASVAKLPDPFSGPGPDVDPDVDPVPAAKEFPPNYFGPRDPLSFDAGELGAALKAANEALNAEGTGGELTADIYEKFRRMGHVLAFTDKGEQLDDRKDAARRLLQDIANDPNRVAVAESLAGALLGGEEVPQGGILLAGIASAVAPPGQRSVYATTVKLAEIDKAISVLSEQPLLFEEGDRVLVLGSILNNPAETVVGYKGERKLMIWAGTTVKVE